MGGAPRPPTPPRGGRPPSTPPLFLKPNTHAIKQMTLLTSTLLFVPVTTLPLFFYDPYQSPPLNPPLNPPYFLFVCKDRETSINHSNHPYIKSDYKQSQQKHTLVFTCGVVRCQDAFATNGWARHSGRLSVRCVKRLSHMGDIHLDAVAHATDKGIFLFLSRSPSR